MSVATDAFLTSHGDELIAVRRAIHARPELGRAEHRTTALVEERLRAAGLHPRRLAGGVGLVCDIGPQSGPVVVLRADLDALPLDDVKDVPYRSTVPGVCHACGHDVHTTVVLGAGLALASVAGTLPGRVRLLFQPAEEVMPGGALDVIVEGVVNDAAAIYALHCDPRLDCGLVGVRSGAITGAADRVEITLSGPGGHTSRPHLTADLVYALSRVVVDLPAALSRRVDPRAGLSLVFGAIHSGTAGNAIPATGTVTGTLRSLDRAAWDEAPKLVEELVAAIAAPLGATWELSYTRGVPPVVNDVSATAVLAAASSSTLGPEAVVPTEQSLGGEDFAWYLERVPGSLARLGVRRDGLDLDLHMGNFDVDERAIGIGVRVLAQTALDALAHYR